MRRYVDLEHGQVHLRDTGAAGLPTLVCLHPLPYSGVFFDAITPRLSGHFRVVSPDYPGFGGSDPLPGQVEDISGGIFHWARVLRQTLQALAPDQPMHLLGFHSGCLVAAELAQDPLLNLSRLVLVDVPCFDPSEAAELANSVATEAEISGEFASMETAWNATVSKRYPVTGLEPSLMLLAEQLKANRCSRAGFMSAFAYPSTRRLALVKQPALVIASSSFLHQPSIRASQLLPEATLLELQDVKAPAFETGADVIAAHVVNYLNHAA